MTTEDLTDAQRFPPNWVPDPTLRDLIPEHDWRLFRRIPAAPTRFAVRIDGKAPFIWNLTKRAPVEPMCEGSKGLRRVRDPNPFISEPKLVQRSQPEKPRLRFKLYLGRLVGEKTFTLARLIAEAVYGPPPHPKSQAHHIQTFDDCHDDHWSNIYWRSPGENLGIEHVRHNLPKQRKGQDNTNAKLSADALHRIIYLADRGTYTVAQLAKRYKLSPAYLRRLLREDARADEVRAIRAQYAASTSFGRITGPQQHNV